MAGGQTRVSPADADQPLGRAWQPYRGVYDVPGRLSRSTTIALVASPIGLLLIAVIRLLTVADYNPATAAGIVSSGGYVDTLLGTIIPLVPIFTPYLALLLLFSTAWLRAPSRSWRPRSCRPWRSPGRWRSTCPAMTCPRPPTAIR